MNKLATFLGALAMVAIAPLARADFSISVNGAAPCASGAGSPSNLPFGEQGSCPNATTANGIAYSGLSTQGLQTVANSQQFTTTLNLLNTTGSTETITIDAATNDFTSPKTPPNITDDFGYTINGTVGAVTASTYTACVDQGNGLTAPTGVCGSPTSLTPTFPITNASAEDVQTITSLHAAFGLNEQVTLTLTAGSSLDVTLSQTLTQVPEPAAIFLFGTMLVGVGIVMRRRTAKQA
jgi:hypothetical protein